MAKKIPALWFIPADEICHPETLVPILRKDVAYSLLAVENIYRETGIDECLGEVVSLHVARMARKHGKIISFRLMSSEE